MNNRYRAVWAVVGLLVVFLGLLVWYMATHPAPRALAPGSPSATTTPPFVDAPAHIVDTGTYHEIDASYPSVTPLSATAGVEADATAVALMRTFAQNSVNTFKESAAIEVPGLGDFARDRKYAMDIDYKLYEGAKTISYVYTIYQDTLGAHPNAYYRTYTFDRASGEFVGLNELFRGDAPYLERLSSRTRADLPNIMAKMAQTYADNIDKDYINSGTLPISDAFQNFAIEGATLLMIFPPYQVGPYVYGTITVPIPLSDLRDILNPRYLP